MQQDCNLPVNYHHRSREAEQKTPRNGSSKRPLTRKGSSVAPMVIASTSHVGNTWLTNEGDSTGAPSTNPTDATLRTVVDLLKKWGKKKTSTDPVSDEEEQAMDEWQTVAMLMDRVMLVVFTVLVLIMYAALFGHVPS